MKNFVELCCNAYNILRKNSNIFINLFSLVYKKLIFFFLFILSIQMLSTGIPELSSPIDLTYLRESLCFHQNDNGFFF